MLKRANQNKEKVEADNVSFITDIPLPDPTVDCIISNCVIKLVPKSDKQSVFKAMFRLLKPGGRVAISDIFAKHELPEHVKNNMALYVGCIAGASQVKDYEKYLREAGFAGKTEARPHRPYPIINCSNVALYRPDILLLDSVSDLNIYNRAKEEGKSCKCCGEGVENACCERTPTCCSGTDPTSESSSKPIEPKLEDVDFNELAGM
jgi:arsenite methyltransferase